MTFYAHSNITVGEEIFSSYGGDDWFSGRGIEIMSPTHESQDNSDSHTLQYLQENMYCMTNVFVGDSHLRMAGKGLFASKKFTKGEVIYVSPVLTLPTDEVVAASDDSVLVNYCIASANSRIALLPIGLGALTNHQSPKYANMDIDWLEDSFDSEAVQKKLNKTVDELLSSKYASLDIAYRATRDIDVGEELTISYGDEWATAWSNYLAALVQWYMSEPTQCSIDPNHSNSDPHSCRAVSPKPKFRYPIQPHDGLFPDLWLQS